MKRYHAHIYFRNESLQEARSLLKDIEKSTLYSFCNIFETPVGPHPLGMIEAHFNEQNYKNAVTWLEIHRNEFVIFIHKDTGDDFNDHEEGVIWLGEQLDLDFSFFERIKKDPKLRIHN